MATTFSSRIPAGSYVVISVGTGTENAVAADYRAAYTAARLYFHTPGQIMSFFDGLDLVPPGAVPACGWSGDAPVPDLEPWQGTFLAGVAESGRTLLNPVAGPVGRHAWFRAGQLARLELAGSHRKAEAMATTLGWRASRRLTRTSTRISRSRRCGPGRGPC